MEGGDTDDQGRDGHGRAVLWRHGVALCHEEDKGSTHGNVADEEEEERMRPRVSSAYFADGSTISAALTVPAIARASVAIKSRLVVFENFSVFMVLKAMSSLLSI